MKLSKLKLKNIGIHKELEIDFGKFTVISGENAQGKTTIENAIIESIEGSDIQLLSNDEETGSIEVYYDNDMAVKIPYRKKGKGSPEIKQGNMRIEKPRTQLEEWHNNAKIRAIDFFDGKGADRKKYQTDTILSILPVTLESEEIQSLTGGELPLKDFFAVDHPLVYIKRLVNEKNGYYYTMRARNNEAVQTITHSNNTLYKKIVEKLNNAGVDPVFFDDSEYRDLSVTDKIKELQSSLNMNVMIQSKKEIMANFEYKMITAEKLKKIELEERRKAFTESIDKDTNKKKSRLVEISIEKEVIKSEITELQRKQINLESENNEIEEKIKIIESEIETKVKEFLVPIEERWANNQTELKTELTNAENFITINKVVETEELSKFIDKIQGVKEILPVYDTWRQGSEEYATMRERGNILSEIIDNLRKLPSEILKREKLPIKGLSMNEDGEFLIVNSHEIAVSLSQLSGFEKTQLSLDISIARLGEIRVLLIPQWAEVDTKNKERIKKHLEESDIQGIAIEVGIGNFKTIKE